MAEMNPNTNLRPFVVGEFPYQEGLRIWLTFQDFTCFAHPYRDKNGLYFFGLKKEDEYFRKTNANIIIVRNEDEISNVEIIVRSELGRRKA